MARYRVLIRDITGNHAAFVVDADNPTEAGTKAQRALRKLEQTDPTAKWLHLTQLGAAPEVEIYKPIEPDVVVVEVFDHESPGGPMF